MDLISLYYLSEQARDLHMTRTANRLFISQQTLSSHIQRLYPGWNHRLLPTAGRMLYHTDEFVSRQKEIPEDIDIFPLHYKGQPLTQRLSLIRKKDRYLSHYSKFFLGQHRTENDAR